MKKKCNFIIMKGILLLIIILSCMVLFIKEPFEEGVSGVTTNQVSYQDAANAANNIRELESTNVSLKKKKDDVAKQLEEKKKLLESMQQKITDFKSTPDYQRQQQEAQNKIEDLRRQYQQKEQECRGNIEDAKAKALEASREFEQYKKDIEFPRQMVLKCQEDSKVFLVQIDSLKEQIEQAKERTRFLNKNLYEVTREIQLIEAKPIQ